VHQAQRPLDALVNVERLMSDEFRITSASLSLVPARPELHEPRGRASFCGSPLPRSGDWMMALASRLFILLRHWLNLVSGMTIRARAYAGANSTRPLSQSGGRKAVQISSTERILPASSRSITALTRVLKSGDVA
jgi:hypothetical protein